HFCAACFGDMVEVAQNAGFDNVDGVMLDLGVSSMQLDDGTRGFSFMRDGPLDMRMGEEGLTAQDLVNDADMDLLATIIAVYGEERRARAIARAIIHRREQGDITRTHELSDIICSILGQPRPRETHPATRTFQALRIYLNDELGELLKALTNAEQILKEGGTLAVVTFHSLEDRMVKQFLTARSAYAPRPSRHLPEAEEVAPRFVLKKRKPISAQQTEIDNNPRARSARLRVAHRTNAPAYDETIGDLMPNRAPRIQDYRQDYMEATS
ncbi:MAG: 16S rRNA (cytosine(1402)-N(4))-methyltransferase RsmH, partial [Alphaproteobacteria bacterium]|nr:16S rRNA (cytosine(1402)-N(4))-methyltransferase RsmH [Alphaproteobacteria bacterium]